MNDGEEKDNNFSVIYRYILEYKANKFGYDTNLLKEQIYKYIALKVFPTKDSFE